MKVVDFRSDTVTKPTPDMLAAMMRAEVGDDVYGEDPTVNALEEKVAKLIGSEAALFASSGTLTNQIAIHLQTRPGETIIAEEQSHVYMYEVGAAAAMSGVQFDLIPFSRGFSDEAIQEIYKPEGPYVSSSSMLVVENTHNRGAGKVFDAKESQRLVRKAHALKMKAHCDGARIWNAAAALKIKESELCADFDSISVCFSKGLGAPVGSALCGSKDLIAKARKLRKRWGGGMRQAGFLAAAAIYALDHNRPRIHEDHTRMRNLIDSLKDLTAKNDKIRIDAPKLNTNIMYLSFPKEYGEKVYAELTELGVKTHLLDPGRLRLLTHLHMTDSDIEYAASQIRKVLIGQGL